MTQNDTITNEQASQETVAPQEAAPASLQLQDLLALTQVLQVVSQRGAIRADEMTNVGGLYDRLVAFLVASGAIKPAEPQAPENQGE